MITDRFINEYLAMYKSELLLRSVLPVRYIERDNVTSYDSKNGGKYKAQCICMGFYTTEVDNEYRLYTNERNCALRVITSTEDFRLTNGDTSVGCVGFADTPNMKFGNVKKTISDVGPKYIVATRQALRNIPDSKDYKKLECQWIQHHNMYYLLPEMTNDIGELVIWKDLFEDPEPIREPGGRLYHEIREWIAIELHDLSKITKLYI